MSLATAADGPEAKKFRFSLPTQVLIQRPSYTFNQNGIKIEKDDREAIAEIKLENLSNALEANPIADMELATDVNTEVAENLSLKPSSETPSTGQNSTAQTPTLPTGQSLMEFSLAMLFQQTNSLLKKHPNKDELKLNLLSSRSPSNPSASSTPSISAPIPGALAVAASPAAQLFSEDDWSWHRNPAAAIRSGGTNKQTPVWKYFVYNKAENLSRCIIGDCTYMLKGPHTSTLACHLKKHPAEYAEFQRLKMEYTKERSTSQLNPASSSSCSSNKSQSRPNLEKPLNLSNGSANFNHNQMFASALMKPKSKPEAPMNPCNGIFGPANPLNAIPALSNGADHVKTANNGKSGQTMSDILNLLNARAAAVSSGNNQSGINLPPFPTTPMPDSPTRDPATVFPSNLFAAANMNNPLNFMNIFKQSTNSPLAQAATAADLLHQTKKWQKQDRKQREMEIKLALTFSAAQLPLVLVKSPFFRDLIETAQPKFTMPSDVSQVEEIINSQFSRTIAALKVQLAATSKVSLLIDVLKLNNNQQNSSSSSNGNDEVVSGTESETAVDDATTVVASAIRLCISAAYFSATTQRMEVVLLGIRQPTNDSDLGTGIRNAVEMLLYEYDLNMDKVSRVLTNGMQEIGIAESLFPRQLEPYNQKLTQALLNVFEVDEQVNELKKAFYSMIFGFLSRPDALSQLNKISGRVVEFPIAESFLVLAEVLLEIKEAFLTVCCQQPLDNPIEILTEQQWSMLDNVVKLLSLFRTHMNVIQDGNYATIDRVVPSLMQLQMSLYKDFPLLGDLPTKLKQDLLSRTAYILDPNSENFDGTWIQATALNPQLAMLLDDTQTVYAKSAIEKMLYEKIRIAEETMARRNGLKAMGGVDALLAAVVERKSSTTSSIAQCSTPSAVSPPLSSSSSTASTDNGNCSSNATSMLYPDLMQAAHQRRKLVQEKQQNGKNLYAEAMVQAYFEDLVHSSAIMNNSHALLGLPQTPLTAALNAAQHLPPLQFWQFSSVKCAQLSEIAIELLTIPSCTVSLERIFNLDCNGNNVSSSSISTLESSYAMLRSIEDPSRMERDAILRFNRAHIPKIF
uniref:HAT C-terminal dimerisation domain-containing protein n=1 Tax=Acrobeloides nanus TaxID=290746 RepID=A0A914E968_9BILA